MDEARWLSETNLTVLLLHAEGAVGERKLRLLSVAYCRGLNELLGDVDRRALDVAERYADGEVSERTLRRAGERVRAEAAELSPFPFTPAARDVNAAVWCAVALPRRTCDSVQLTQAAAMRVQLAIQAVRLPDEHERNAYWKHYADVFRDVAGYPFRPVTLHPRWQSETVVALATGIYADRAFDRLPVLADALEEAGCDNRDLLAHCRGPGPHVRGCWAVDLLLGKA